MSGTKRITVDAAEWTRLQQKAEQLRVVQKNMPSLIEGVRAQTQREVRAAMTAVNDREKRFEQALGAMGEQVREVELASARNLQKHTTEMRNLLASTAGDLRRETKSYVDDVKKMVSAERKQREQAVAAVAAQLSAITASRDQAASAATQWLKDAASMAAYVRESLPHERFAPGQLEALSQRLRLAQQNLVAGLAETAIAAGQDCYRELSSLRISLELQDREWRMLHGAASESLRVLVAMIDDNRIRKGVSEDGELTDVDLDVDYWSEGRLSALATEASALLARVQGKAAELSTADLREIVEQLSADIEGRLADITQHAGAAQLASQIRVNIADLVVQTLVANGYHLDDGVYEGEDPRAGFVAKVLHPDGSDVVVLVSPVPGDPPGSQVWIESTDANPGAETSRVERAKELAQRLRENGLQISDPEEMTAPVSVGAIDVDAVRRERPGTVFRLPLGRA